jgi:hypothetical protein
LYVPASAVEIARRLSVENQVNVTELWSYHTIGDQTRFTMVQRSASAPVTREPAPEARPAAAETPKPAETPRQRASAPARTARKPARTTRKPAPAARGAKTRSGRAKPAPRRSARTQKRK